MTMEQSEQQEIDDGRRVEAILAEPVMKRALNAVRDKVYAEFLAAKTTDERTNAWAKSNALAEVVNELITIGSNGKIAQRQRDTREERQRAAKQFTGRK